MILRPQRYRSLLGFLLGIFISVIILGLAFFYYQSITKKYYEQKMLEVGKLAVKEYIESHPTKLIYIAVSDKNAGEVITDQDLIPAEISEDIFPTNAITDPLEVIGKVARCDITKNTTITSSLLYTESDYPDDMRLVEYTTVSIPQKLEPMEFVDIRIMFPNGLDYIVLSKKQVTDLQRQSAEIRNNTIWFHSVEEEILRMASAIIDASIVEGTILYAVPYVAPEIQKEAVKTYPTNPEVINLILKNPNILEKAVTELELRNRKDFEYKINENFENSGRNKVFGDNTDSVMANVNENQDIEADVEASLEDKL